MTAEATTGAHTRRRLTLRADQVVPWVVRVLWVAIPFTVGPVLGEALAGASRAVQLVASLGLWSGWAAGLVATAVALPVSLTALRLLAPTVAGAVVAAALGGHRSALAAGWAVVTVGWVFSPVVGARCVNGPAYPNERRFLLRAPGPLLLGGLPLVWAVLVVAVAAGPLLLAARQWVGGGLALAAGWPVAFVLLRAVHDLSRRWAVLVPAGLVVHDPLTLVDPVLLVRRVIARIGPGPVSTSARDLTQRAPGLAVEIDLREEVDVSVVRPGRRVGEATKVRAVLITPTRPGALLDEARQRRLPVRPKRSG